MENAIIILILVLVVFLAFQRARKHFRGGGCCGSGSNTIRTRKTLTQPVIAKKVLTIDGMHCENCQARVENAIDRFPQAACTVDLRKKTATVSLCAPLSDQELIQAVEKLGYHVTGIQ